MITMFTILLCEYITAPYQYEWVKEKENFDTSTLSRKITNKYMNIMWNLTGIIEEIILPSKRKKY